MAIVRRGVGGAEEEQASSGGGGGCVGEVGLDRGGLGWLILH